ERPDLPRALPIDFQDDVGAGRRLLVDPLARGAVQVAVHLRPLQEFAREPSLAEFRLRNEAVVLAMTLAVARRPRGERNRMADLRTRLHQRTHQRRLPGSRRSDDDQDRAGGRGHAVVAGGVTKPQVYQARPARPRDADGWR